MIETGYHIEATAAELDARLRRVEAAMTALTDTHLMEDRVADRVVQRLKRAPAKSLRESVVVEAGRLLTGQMEKIDGNGTPPMAALAPPTAVEPYPESAAWLPFQFWGEVRTLMRMLADHRYPFSFLGRIGPLCVVLIYLFGMFFLPLFIERVLDIVLAIVLYKILHREVRRYRSMFPGQ